MGFGWLRADRCSVAADTPERFQMLTYALTEIWHSLVLRMRLCAIRAWYGQSVQARERLTGLERGRRSITPWLTCSTIALKLHANEMIL